MAERGPVGRGRGVGSGRVARSSLASAQIVRTAPLAPLLSLYLSRFLRCYVTRHAAALRFPLLDHASQFIR